MVSASGNSPWETSGPTALDRPYQRPALVVDAVVWVVVGVHRPLFLFCISSGAACCLPEFVFAFYLEQLFLIKLRLKVRVLTQ